MPTEVYPVTADRWPDLEALFGPKGGYGGCRCLARRVKRAEFSQLGSEGRKAEVHRLTHRDPAPRGLAHQNGGPGRRGPHRPAREVPAAKGSPRLKQA